MTKGKRKNYESDLDLEKIIQTVADEILKSQRRIKDSGGKSLFFVEKVKVSISFVVRRSGQGGIKLHVVEADGSISSEQTHRVELELSTVPPLLNSLLSHIQPTQAKAEELLASFTQQAGQ